ncbi:rod shape-determining protein MreD [Neomoorella thermoacetica]|uniref:rod shape-determining protein MreD n=1 Tax=Neomoorella thermoacetica TaxID=1525 RepID=UPI0013960825|nr:rod shape-determining protein MreD [Moorella thermoacetica]
MMQFLGLLALGLGGLVLEATLLPALKLAEVKADLLTIVLTIYALFQGPSRGAVLGFGYGLLEDLYLGRYVGLNALSKMLTGYIIGLGKDRLNQDNWLVPGIMAFFAIICQGLLVLFLTLLAGFRFPLLAGLEAVILPMSFYNACLALLGYNLYQGGIKWATRKRRIGSPG